MLFTIRMRMTRTLSTRSMLRHLQRITNLRTRSINLITISISTCFEFTRLRIRINRLRREILVSFLRRRQRRLYRFISVNNLRCMLSKRATATAARQKALLRRDTNFNFLTSNPKRFFHRFRLNMIAIHRILWHGLGISTTTPRANTSNFHVKCSKIRRNVSILYMITCVLVNGALHATYIRNGRQTIFRQDRFNKGLSPRMSSRTRRRSNRERYPRAIARCNFRQATV